MPTTSQYLSHLQTDKANLVANLIAKGVSASNSETFTSLIPKVLNISGGDIKLFETIAEMNSYSNPRDSDLAMVYSVDDNTAPIDNYNKFYNLIFPKNVQLDNPITNQYWIEFEPVDTSLSDSCNISVQLSPNNCSINISYFDSTSIEIYYQGDGYSYELIDSTTYEPVDEDIMVSCGEGGCHFSYGDWTDEIGYFMISGTIDYSFGGLYQYSSNTTTWNNLPNQLDATSSDVVNGKTAYSNAGIITGSFGDKSSIFFNDDLAKVWYEAYSFSDGYNLTNAEVSSFQNSYFFRKKGSNGTVLINTSSVTNLASMFQNNTNLEYLDLSGFDTSNVTSMSSMFSGCTNLKFIDLSSFTGEVLTSMSSMFSSCDELKYIDLSSFNNNTASLTSINGMFNNCRNLKKIYLGDLNTSRITSLSNMFSNCLKLEEIDLSQNNFSSVTNCRYMFTGCKACKKIDISSWSTLTNITNSYYYNDMFGNASTGVPNNCLIYVHDANCKSWIETKFSRLTNVQIKT